MNPLLNAMAGNAGGQLAQIAQMVKSGNPEQIAQNLMRNNPQFAAFMQANQGKTPEQVAKENGIDFGVIQKLL